MVSTNQDLNSPLHLEKLECSMDTKHALENLLREKKFSKLLRLESIDMDKSLKIFVSLMPEKNEIQDVHTYLQHASSQIDCYLNKSDIEFAYF